MGGMKGVVVEVVKGWQVTLLGVCVCVCLYCGVTLPLAAGGCDWGYNYVGLR